MYTIINYILLAIISILSLKYIFTPVERVKDPFEKKLKLQVSGTQRFFLLVLSIGILQLGSLVSIRLLFSIFLCLLAFLYDKNRPVLSFVTWLYVLFLCWLVCAIFYSPVKSYGVRVFLKYFYPFVVLLLAAKLSHTGLFTFKAMKNILQVAVLGLVAVVIFPRIPFVNQLSASLFWWLPAILDFLPVPICIALAMVTLFKKKRYIWYVLLFFLPSIVMVNRTGLLAASLTVAIFSIVRFKVKSVPYVIVGIAIFVGAILYIPEFRAKMFKKNLSTEQIIEDREDLSSEDIDSSGRFAMWEWSLKNYYDGKELTGSGLGVLQEAFYSFKHPFGSIRIVHNDYVQLLCDTGLIGLVLYASIFIFLFLHSIILAWRRDTPNSIRFLAFIAGPSIAGMAVTLYTDNAVNYSLMTLSYPFAVYGLMIGLMKRTNSA